MVFHRPYRPNSDTKQQLQWKHFNAQLVSAGWDIERWIPTASEVVVHCFLHVERSGWGLLHPLLRRIGKKSLQSGKSKKTHNMKAHAKPPGPPCLPPPTVGPGRVVISEAPRALERDLSAVNAVVKDPLRPVGDSKPTVSRSFGSRQPHLLLRVLVVLYS